MLTAPSFPNGWPMSLLQRTENVINAREYYEFTHFTDALMTDQEILELPKVWVVGGDGGMGDIGYQNTSKVILQNRPNVKALMLDTQVYSNTGGQNSDSTPMLGGNDMNVFGAATQGKNVEKKTVAETFLAGHGSPFIAQVSIANAPKLYRAILDGIEYRGTAFLQCFTTCQPEHGVADDMALTQAQRVRDSRGAPEFVFNPRLGETYQEALDLKGNPSLERDWYETKFKATNEPYRYTVAHWCATEARFRNHLKKIKKEDAAKMIPLENMLVRVTQQDVVYRRYLVHGHRSYIPTSACTSRCRDPQGGRIPLALAPVGAVLRRAPQGLAHAAEQGGDREQGIQSPTLDPGGRGCGQNLPRGFLRARGGIAEGEARAAERKRLVLLLRRLRLRQSRPLRLPEKITAVRVTEVIEKTTVTVVATQPAANMASVAESVMQEQEVHQRLIELDVDPGRDSYRK